jgi:hypothetical protein
VRRVCRDEADRLCGKHVAVCLPTRPKWQSKTGSTPIPAKFSNLPESLAVVCKFCIFINP